MLITITGVDFQFAYFKNSDALKQLAETAMDLEKDIVSLKKTWKDDTDNPTTSRYGSYNLLKVERPCIRALADFLREQCLCYLEQRNDRSADYWIQCWINIHRKGQSLHQHRHLGYRLHGHMTVAAENTNTYYGPDDEICIKNEPGLLTIIGEDDVLHRVSANPSEHPRISIAFDVIGKEQLVHFQENRVVVPFIQRSKQTANL